MPRRRFSSYHADAHSHPNDQLPAFILSYLPEHTVDFSCIGPDIWMHAFWPERVNPDTPVLIAVERVSHRNDDEIMPFYVTTRRDILATEGA